MHARLQVSTDVAALGLWDRDQPTALPGGEVATLEELARRGEACIVGMGGDCGGTVDVFVDEDIPVELRAESVLMAEERTIVVRSGEVVIDGIEYFGAGKKNLSETSSVCRLPNGTYRTRIRLTKNEDGLLEPNSEKEMRQAIGPEEVDYYDKANRNGLLVGLSTLLILPLLLFLVRWYVAIPVTLGVFIGYFHFQQWLLRRNPRYQNAAERIVPMRLAGVRPILSVQFSTWHGELLGGSPISMAALPNEEL